MKRLFFEDVEAGTQIPSLVHRVSLFHLIRYSAATWNFYLLHLEKEYALEKGFRDANVHAPFFGSFLATTMTRWAGDPGMLKRLEYTVKVMCFPGDILMSRGSVAKKYQEAGQYRLNCEIWVEKQDGTKVASGSATIACLSKENG